MTERDAFLRAICDEPGDDTPRLVFADWLDEHDERERAEFIRVQCRLNHLGNPPHQVLEAIISSPYGPNYFSLTGGEDLKCGGRLIMKAKVGDRVDILDGQLARKDKVKSLHGLRITKILADEIVLVKDADSKPWRGWKDLSRETALLICNRAAWSRWKCPECGGGTLSKCELKGIRYQTVAEAMKVVEAGDKVLVFECPCCRDGNLFARGAVEVVAGSAIGQAAYLTLPIHFRRGFPHAVEVPDMGWVCREERRERQSRLIPREFGGMEREYWGGGVDYHPTPWLRAVARHTTIEEVWVMDRVALEQPGYGELSGKSSFDWLDADSPHGWEQDAATQSAIIPNPVFRLVKKMETPDGATCQAQFPSPDAAHSVAGRAWVEWAMKEEVRGCG